MKKKLKVADKEKTRILSSSGTNISTNRKVTKGLIAFTIVIVGVNLGSSFALRQTVDVVKLKAPVPQDGVITEDNMVKDKMLKAEYEKQGLMKFSDGSEKRQIVLWEDREKIKGAYASYYVRENAPVYWDSLTKDTPKKYAYLYNMDGELLRLDIDATQFGEMLVPGDKINVRVSYNDTLYTLPDEEQYAIQQQTGLEMETTIPVQEMLFSSATVLDMLNGEGQSIFDIYYDLLSMPKAKQQEQMESEEFKTLVTPTKILLNVTPEEADRYMSIQNKGGQYLVTLLPRTGSNAITDALNELQTGFARSSK